MKLHVVGIDLGEMVFHLVEMDSTSWLVIRRKRFSHATAGFHRKFTGAPDWHGVAPNPRTRELPSAP